MLIQILSAMQLRSFRSVIVGAVLLGGPAIAFSQDDVSAEVPTTPTTQSANVSVGRQAQNASAAPVRSARLSFLQGPVNVDQANNAGNAEGQLNMPLVEGDRISTGDDGQAEVEFEDGSVVRLTPASSLTLEQLSLNGSSASTRLGLDAGQFYLSLRVSSKGSYYVDAAGDGISPSENAVIRVKLDQPPAEIGVLQGTAVVEREGGFSAEVRGGESLKDDPKSASRYLLTENVPSDSWDDWNEQREQVAANEADQRTAARDDYAGNQGYGWSDLDSNGTWYDVPGQGQIWQPYGADSASWDPYGYGSWVYYPGSGYVWASSYSWGWTPYRCGSWGYWSGFGWGWSPVIGCGGYGWGFGGGGGYYVNVGSWPSRYVPLRRPVTGVPVHGRPIIQGRPGRPVPVQRPIGPVTRPVQWNGRQVTALRPVGQPVTPHGESAVGSSLRRDFAVDRTSKQPVMGTLARPSVAVLPGNGWQSVRGQRTVGSTGGGAQPSGGDGRVVYNSRPGQTTNQGSPQVRSGMVNSPQQPQQRPDWNRPGVVQRPQGLAPQQRPQSIPESRSAPVQRYSPPPQISRPAPSAPPPSAPRMSAPSAPASAPARSSPR